jgi:hypothetical protein
MPYSVFVEVAAAIRRRTGSEELAHEIDEKISNDLEISRRFPNY